MDAVLRETLRLCPVGVVNRRCEETTTLGDIAIEKGTYQGWAISHFRISHLSHFLARKVSHSAFRFLVQMRNLFRFFLKYFFIFKKFFKIIMSLIWKYFSLSGRVAFCKSCSFSKNYMTRVTRSQMPLSRESSALSLYVENVVNICTLDFYGQI
uniref:Uncharacterized protein n=1 Tax=Meloidogyne enterolobii TaxID=390850 RepID=A0A6V7W8K9_MELEN|nr:unnamed protein product [Meloidogyne enterolobii]